MKLTCLLSFTMLAAGLACAQSSFTVDFSQCTEFAGVGPIDYAKASALVPSPLQAANVADPTNPQPNGAIVVRATSCESVKINSGPAKATNLSQIGVEITPPDNTGDINNYTLIYVTDNPALVLAFNLAGVPATYDPTLTYQFTYDATGKSGELYVKAESLAVPAYFISGTETDPASPPQDFKANWWYLAGHRLIKQASDFPDIAFGTATVGVHTNKYSLLGNLIGGNSYSTFSILPLRGVYPSAHMQVSASY